MRWSLLLSVAHYLLSKWFGYQNSLIDNVTSAKTKYTQIVSHMDQMYIFIEFLFVVLMLIKQLPIECLMKICVKMLPLAISPDILYRLTFV